MPKCWETRYGMLLLMANEQNFDAKIYQDAIKWQMACCRIIST
jgi:hypothetical protein